MFVSIFYHEGHKGWHKGTRSKVRIISEFIFSVSKLNSVIHLFIILFFNCQMESKISEANTHPPAGGFGCMDIFSWVFLVCLSGKSDKTYKGYSNNKSMLAQLG